MYKWAAAATGAGAEAAGAAEGLAISNIWLCTAVQGREAELAVRHAWQSYMFYQLGQGTVQWDTM